MSATRKSGYYWVKRGGTWEPAHWTGSVWVMFGDSYDVYDDSDFEEIYETPIERVDKQSKNEGRGGVKK